VYRAGGPVLAGDIEAYEPGNATYTDVCVDRNGIVLEEYWVDKGELLRRRVATELEIDQPLDRDIFAVDIPEDEDVDRGAVGRIDVEPSEDGPPIWSFDEEPKGFDRLGHFAVVRSKQTIPQTGGGPAPSVASTSEVFVRGPDVLIIDQDPSLGSLIQAESRPSRDVDVGGPFVNATLILDSRMSEVRGRTVDGSVVRVFGTMATEELVKLARGLEPLED
jgi:hypothetical protein